MLADLKMPGALEAVDGILSKADGGSITAAEAIQELLGAQISLQEQPTAAGSHALLAAARGEDPGGVRLLLPAIHQARAQAQLGDEASVRKTNSSVAGDNNVIQ
jgi:hypothetical protein